MTTNLHVSFTASATSSRLLKETRSLVTAGLADRVCIVALHNGDQLEVEQVEPTIRIIRVRLRTRGLSRSLVAQLMKYLEFAWRVLTIGWAEKPAIHNVHSIALLPIGVLLKLTCGGKLVYDAHELETEVDGLHGMRKRLAKLLERLCIGFADLVMVVSPGIEDWYREHYGNLPTVTILNVPPYSPRAASTLLRDELAIPEGRRIALYQGGLTSNRGIEQLLAAAGQFDAAGYDLVLMGYGPLQPLVQSVSAECRNVHFRPAVPASVLLRYTASADLGFSWIGGDCLSYRLCLPNKLFEYIMAGVPVIASNLPEMASIIVPQDIGICLESWQADELGRALTSIDALRGDALDARLDALARTYCWENQEPKLLAAYHRHLGVGVSQRPGVS